MWDGVLVIRGCCDIGLNIDRCVGEVGWCGVDLWVVCSVGQVG
jgi:hypothetical protein